MPLSQFTKWSYFTTSISLLKLLFIVTFSEHKLVLVGLDNAGKTTILYQLLLGEAVHTRPTIGSNVEEVVWRNLRFVMWDLGGQQSLRSAWNTYYTNSEVSSCYLSVFIMLCTQSMCMYTCDMYNIIILLLWKCQLHTYICWAI